MPEYSFEGLLLKLMCQCFGLDVNVIRGKALMLEELGKTGEMEGVARDE